MKSRLNFDSVTTFTGKVIFFLIFICRLQLTICHGLLENNMGKGPSAFVKDIASVSPRCGIGVSFFLCSGLYDKH